MAKGTTVTMYSRANDTHANNIGAKEAWGHKKRENLFVNSFVGTSAGGISYVNSKTRSTNDVQGAIVNTEVVSDIGIDGAGMLVVADSATGRDVYTRRGDFRQDELGFWKNGGGQLLKAWKLDGEGNLPQNSSLLSSLEAVNFANTKGAPVATSVISIAMNLNADQQALRGPGVDAVLNTGGLNKATQTDSILLPEQGLNIGDSFTFTSTPPGLAKTVTFGGLVAGNQASITNPILGATSDSTQFAFGGAQGQLVSGASKLTITVSGVSYTFTALQGANNAKNKTFSTIKGLASAINDVSSLQARVDENGRLYVAPTKAEAALTFTESGNNANTSLRASLGLADLGAQADRFNSLATLRNAVNKGQELNSFKATIEGKGVKITSLLSTAGFNITGSSLGVHDITSAILNPATAANPVPGEIGRSTLYITAPNSGLINGDYVRIEGFGVLVADGLYAVSGSDNNGFVVSLAVVPAAIPVLGAAFAQPVAGSTWQKVPGQQFAATGACTLAAAGPGANDITVTIPGGQAFTGVLPQENWANGDVVYISGVGTVSQGGQDVTLPDGYYIIAGFVQAPGLGVSTFTVTAAANVGAAGAPAAGPFTVRKVGSTGGAFGGGVGAATGTFDVPVMTTADVGTGKIKYYVGNNHGYTVGDVISLTQGHAIDGINFAANTNYKITDIGGNFVKFEVVGGVAINGNGTNVVTYNDGPLANLRTNNFSRLFEFFGINQEKTDYDATYAADNVDKNLTSGKFASSETFSHPLTVYDSLGSSYTLLLNFAKLATNKWAVEVAAQQDKDGIFDIQGLLTDNGVLRAGIIDFDTDGNVITPVQGFDAPLQVQRNNGSALSNITIDWENTLSDIQSGTVTQNKNPNNVEIVQGNGQPAGTLVNLAISPEGFVVGTFDSGESRNLYQIPLALFANVNGLTAGSNGVFEISRESGELLLKAAGVGGAGNTLGGVLEASNTNTTTELLSVQELSNTIRANARVAATEFKNIQTILSELNN